MIKSNYQKLVEWWSKTRLRPLIEIATSTLPTKTVGEELVRRGAALMREAGATEDEVLAAAAPPPE